ncbi:MAG: glycogen synthase GlgA [Candidatus Omnitrophota bacterium]
MKLLFASSEVDPFAKTGGLADVSGSLPRALLSIGCETTVILPFYRSVKKLGIPLPSLKIAEFDYREYTKDGVKYIFVVNEEYYDRDNLYSEAEGDYGDNDLRFSHFCKAIVAYALGTDAGWDIIHCNDWQTGLVPIYLQLRKSPIKTLFTIHNIGYQGLFKRDALGKLDIPGRFYKIEGIEYYGKISFLKAGIVYSSAVSTVSKGYRDEILTPEFGCGMDGILRTRSSCVYGILNGVDYSEWDPVQDKHIISRYNAESIEKKVDCKKDLIGAINFRNETLERPLIGVISRLAEQKGIDLIVGAAKEIIDLGASIVILGTGDERYNSLCKSMQEGHPLYISSQIKFDNSLAHKIEAGSDMFVMPSRYEPCGLNQLYSLRYGTLPIVRATGGLDDTIVDLYKDKDNGNGIKFKDATEEDLVDAVSRAIALYRDKGRWQSILKRIMKMDFSWKRSALRYKELYEKILKS